MIEKFTIYNFLSIKYATVQLKRINLLIGPNNAGKSNFLKSLIHLKQSLFNFSFGYFSLQVDNDNKDNKETEFSIEFNNKQFVTSISAKDAILNDNPTDAEGELYELLLGAKIYKPDIGKLHLPYTIFQDDATILPDASNMAAFLQTCLNKHRKQFNIITEELKKVLPIFEEIIIENVATQPIDYPEGSRKKQPDRPEIPKIKIGFRDIADRIIWAEELSEGALYFLALLCIIHQPNQPKLLLLEEPERSMHPRRIKEVIDLICNLSDEKDIQVIMTTHSPLVVDLFEEEPESIFVFEMKDGFTEIKNLESDIIEPTNKALKEKGVDITKDYETTLGEKWVYGFLGGVPI
jgi:predicted ATPase